MSQDLFDIPIDCEAEPPAVPLDDDPPAIALADAAPVAVAVASETALAPVAGLVELLPADFKLPLLIRFIPNPQLRIAADQAAAYAEGLAVTGPEGCQRADLALTALRASLKAIEEHFAEPTSVANDLHKRLTGIRAEWQARGAASVKTVGQRIYAEQRRLEALAAEARRTAQAEADRLAKEAARKEAAQAEQQQAPPAVVQELRKQAETATAPPVPVSAAAPAPLRGSSAVTTWKARPAGTPGSDEPNPTTEQLSPVQRQHVFTLLRAILDGKAPLAAIELSWQYLNKRAKADKSALDIPGIEAFEEGSVRAKGVRSR